MLRGSKSRNKVSVGEPAEGSLTRIQRINHVNRKLCESGCGRDAQASFDPWAFIFFLKPI